MIRSHRQQIGTPIPIDRIAADRPFYSGKHTMHGMNLQVIAPPDGTILWVSSQGPQQARISEGRQPGTRRLRGPGERANAQLKTWRVLRKLRCSPHRAGRLAKAIHVPQNDEHPAG